jgi:hypothetical protein
MALVAGEGPETKIEIAHSEPSVTDRHICLGLGCADLITVRRCVVQ